jgi:pimeloyl-ACP methyl ester carboxylesterase
MEPGAARQVTMPFVRINDHDVEQCMLHMDDGEFLKTWEAIYSFDMQPLSKITCPTLVLNGEHESKGALHHSAEILRRVPQAQARIIPAASHAMTQENPEAFNRCLEQILSIER